MKQLLLKVWRGWVTRSLAVGAVATAVDVGIGSLLVFAFGWPTAGSAMAALAVGSTLNFYGQRRFAFDEKKVAMPAAKWAAMTGVQLVVHGQLVHVFRDWWGVPYPLAKMGGDIIVFGVLQLVLLRYVVFAKAKEPAPTPGASPSESIPAPAASPAPP
ncbi:MAG: GtrA family protein [Myxococcaceae bacterium]|nr:GtrA family protein [Myxococcaceae bacterium]